MARLGVKMPAPKSTPPSSGNVPTSQEKSKAASAAASAAAPKPVPARATSAIPASRQRPTTSTSREEMEAKRLRQQEEAKRKAQMLKEKEEIARERKRDVAVGLGVSGFAVQTSETGEVEVGLASAHATSSVFNPYEFLGGTSGQFPTRTFSPIYRVPPFWALLGLDSYIRRFPPSVDKEAGVAAKYEQLCKAISFVCHVVVESDNLSRSGRGRFRFRKEPKRQGDDTALAFIRTNHWALEACIRLISVLPHSAGATGSQLDALFLNFINVFMPLIENLQPNQQLVLPGGWQQPDYAHLCLYIVRNCGDNKYSFTVCNTGKDGLEYHPSSFDSETGKQLKQLAMTIWNIPSSRLMDSSFWVVLFRMQVYPTKKNTAAFLYTKLLPALNSQPLMSNLDQGPHEFLEPPDAISAMSFHPLARIALATTPAVGARPARYTTLLIMNAAVDLAFADIENAGRSSMDPEDTRILKLTGRNLSNFASTIDPMVVPDGSLGASLSNTWDVLDKLLKKLNYSSSKPLDQYSHGLSATARNDSFSKGKIESLRTDAGSAAHPLFGRMRTDNYEQVVRDLMGDPRPDPILIPAVLTDDSLPPVATNYQEAGSSLQRIADACSLLLQQRKLVKNAAAFAASASQYALMTILPLPHLDPTYCFWRKGKMRRETQVNLLFLIRRMCRIYGAATACVQQSRGLVAIRSTALACAACVADAICRVKAVDDPSAFALHYSGLCEGPTEQFGIEAGAFDTLGSNLPIYDPNICSIRFQCLDYLRGISMKLDGSKRLTIFNYDVSLSPMEGDVELITQLAIQLALPRPHPPTPEARANHAATLITGRNGALVEVVQEFEFFRDIVFYFKHSVSGKAAQAPPLPNKPPIAWYPSDAILQWELQRVEKDSPILVYKVSSFRGHPQEYVDRIASVEKKQDNAFKGFLSLFGNTKVERARLSSADPTNVVNSCGEKFQKAR